MDTIIIKTEIIEWNPVEMSRQEDDNFDLVIYCLGQ